jgi:anti-sigma-K factor RskA
MSGSPDDDDILAAELALGLLDEPERGSAEARAETDRVFAAAVEAWRVRLAPMLAASLETPPDYVWEAIRSRLAANDDAAPSPAEAALRRWRLFGIGASALAASLALVLVTREPVRAPLPAPAPQAQAPAPVLVATLQGEDGPAVVTISVDPGGRMLVTPVRLPTDGRVPELWVIPEDGKPRSLGVIQAGGPSALAVAPAHRPHVHQGATFAISQEPEGGSSTGAPTGPVVASGKISIV